MTDIEIFSAMIKPRATISTTTERERRIVKLKEPSSANSEVTIRGLPDEVLIIKSDAWPSPDTVFAGTKGECKRADFAIVASVQGAAALIFIEMKSAHTGSRKDIVDQLAGAKCFIDYCQSIGRQFWGNREFLANTVCRFVCFVHTGSIRKSRTRITRGSGKHDEPERFLKIEWPSHIEFNKLASLRD